MPSSNYRPSKSCMLCNDCHLNLDGLPVCSFGVNVYDMEEEEYNNWLKEQEPINPDFVCDGYE